jgi:hypothetical protein
VYDTAVPASHRSSELRLPTKVVAVRLALIGGMPSAAEMFVADVPRRGRGHLLDDLAAQLDAPTAFIPVRWPGRVRLLGKHAIAWLAVHRRGPEDEPSTDFSSEPSEELTLYDREHIVELELVHGTKLIGTLLDSSPADRTRVIDHLNCAGAFVRLWTADDHYLVNTRQIVAVTELGESR